MLLIVCAILLGIMVVLLFAPVQAEVHVDQVNAEGRASLDIHFARVIPIVFIRVVWIWGEDIEVNARYPLLFREKKRYVKTVSTRKYWQSIVQNIRFIKGINQRMKYKVLNGHISVGFTSDAVATALFSGGLNMVLRPVMGSIHQRVVGECNFYVEPVFTEGILSTHAHCITEVLPWHIILERMKSRRKK